MLLNVVILQPSYLPWIGYFDQMHKADVFVYYDDVQYDRDGWRNRNRIRTKEGSQWLTVPVRLKGKFGIALNEIEIDEARDWRKKHRQSLHQGYARAPHIDRYRSGIDAILSEPTEKLVELNIRLTEHLNQELGIRTKTVRSSELGIGGGRVERLVSICQHVGASRYLTGEAAKNYLDASLFADAGIEIEFHDYRHPEYPQIHGGFTPYMSVVDLLFNCGPSSLKILEGRVG